jgi:malonyl-CoA O-methyltransferase
VSLLSPRDGYRLWAPAYEAETAISQLDDRLVGEMTPPLSGRWLADIGCGTGRRLRRSGAAFAVGVDLTPEMMMAGVAADRASRLVAADVRALPLATARFDVVWCRLVVGHLAVLSEVYRELARICRSGALVIVTDFHPEAAAAGHRRTFQDAAGSSHEIEHHVHTLDSHVAHARAAGLAPTDRREGRVGPEIRPFYVHAGKLEAYAEQLGLGLVLALGFRRRADG